MGVKMSNKRSDDRLGVLWNGYLETDDGIRHDCAVRDISDAGALVSCAAKVPTGTDVMLVVDGLAEIAARIQWSGDRGYGLMLLVGDDLALKKFAESAGSDLSTRPTAS